MDRIDEVRQGIVSAAAGILNQSVGLIEGCRTIVRLAHQLDDGVIEKSVLVPFVAFESETDDVPAGSERSLWNTEALHRKDLEVRTYLEGMRPDLEQACSELILALSEPQ